PLSQQIQQLERILHCTLFDRSQRRVRLTEGGALLLPEARRILADAAYATSLLRRVGKGETGTLSIGFAPSTVFSILPTAVRHFRESFPSVRVRLRELVSRNDFGEALLAGVVDVAIEREPEPRDGILMASMQDEHFVAA